MLAGWARIFASFNKATAATCRIMKPECVPACGARKGGKPSLVSGLTSRSVRRSLMLIRSVTAMAA